MEMKMESLRGPHPAKYPQRYSDEEKQRALEIFRTDGPVKAFAETGIAPSTVTNWARKAGVESLAPAAGLERVRAGKLMWEERRVIIAEKVGDLAEEALDLSRDYIAQGDARSAKDAASTMGMAIDKAQLLTGGPTERIGLEEKFTEREDEIARIRAAAQAGALETSSQAALSSAPAAETPGDGYPGPTDQESLF